MLKPLLKRLTTLSLRFYYAAFVEPPDHLCVLEEDADLLVVGGTYRTIVFNKRYGTVKYGSRLLTRFDAIRCVTIRYWRAGEFGERDTWIVTLSSGLWRRVKVGASNDSADASIVAAHIASITGKEVKTSFWSAKGGAG